MESNKKTINNINNVKGVFLKKNIIINPISRNKFNKSNSEYIKIFNNPKSNRFIYTKVINKMKLKNSSLFFSKRNNHSELKNKINDMKSFLKEKNFNIKKYTEKNNNNKKNLIDKNSIYNKIYQEEKKKLNLYSTEMRIRNENKLIYKNKRDNISFKEILQLWDKFYIPVSYRNIFNAIFNQLDIKDRNKLLINEFNDLDELKIDIDTLLEKIKLRKEILYQLKEINKNLKLIFKSDGKEPNLILVKKMSNNIEELRNITINICFLMKKIKNKIYNGNYTGKYNLDIISQNFHFDKNYLIKMKEELNFLKEGNAKYFFNISEDQSPFLIKASEEDNESKKDPFIYIVPITDEIGTKIEKCNYIIYQELIAYQNKDFNNNIFRPISPPDEFNNLFGESMNTQKQNIKTNNYNYFNLEKSKRRTEKLIPKRESEIKYPRIKRNKNYQNAILKSNSCINFQIKSKEFKNRTMFMTDIEKIKKNKNFIEISNNDENNAEKSK